MNPLLDLKDMVTRSVRIESGIVVSVQNASIRVKTRGGLKSFSIPNASAYKPGDTVRFQGNVILGKSVSAESIPIFQV